MSDLDAVVLAGGKSERLRGVVPPYHKPFIVINGKSLLVAAVDHAKHVGAQQVVVVATGENALPVWQLVGHIPGVHVILDSGGVGQAVRRGLQLCQHDRVLVLMSDNIHTTSDVEMIVESRYAIGVKFVQGDEALRYTRLVNHRWVENRHDLIGDSDSSTVWCGPLIIDRMCGLTTLFEQEKIGPHINELFPKFAQPALIPVQSHDIGTPEAVKQFT